MAKMTYIFLGLLVAALGSEAMGRTPVVAKMPRKAMHQNQVIRSDPIGGISMAATVYKRTHLPTIVQRKFLDADNCEIPCNRNAETGEYSCPDEYNCPCTIESNGFNVVRVCRPDVPSDEENLY